MLVALALKSLAGHEPELDGGDGAAAVAVEEGEDLAILLDLVLGQEDVDVLRLHLKQISGGFMTCSGHGF